MTPELAPPGPPASIHFREGLPKRVVTNLMRALPVRVYGRLVARPVIGLCYHIAADRSPPHVRHLYRCKTPAEFEADLLYLRRNFRVLSYDELERGARGGKPGVVVTFDDGLVECFTTVRPLLLKHGVPCTFFVSPPHLDNRRMLSPDRASLALDALERAPEAERRERIARIGELTGLEFADREALGRWLTTWIRTVADEREALLEAICEAAGANPAAYVDQAAPYLTTEQLLRLRDDGFTIGAHGLRHLALGAFPDEVVRHEIVESCRRVGELTGRERVPFAFPFDANGVDRGSLRALLAEEPRVGLLFGTGRMRADEEFLVNRIIVDAPGALGSPPSNLGVYLRAAYLEEMVRPLRGVA